MSLVKLILLALPALAIAGPSPEGDYAVEGQYGEAPPHNGSYPEEAPCTTAITTTEAVTTVADPVEPCTDDPEPVVTTTAAACDVCEEDPVSATPIPLPSPACGGADCEEEEEPECEDGDYDDEAGCDCGEEEDDDPCGGPTCGEEEEDEEPPKCSDCGEPEGPPEGDDSPCDGTHCGAPQPTGGIPCNGTACGGDDGGEGDSPPIIGGNTKLQAIGAGILLAALPLLM